MRGFYRVAGVVVMVAAPLVPVMVLPPTVAAAPAANGSSTVLVLDVSGSMGDPAQIPPDFPQAAQLKAGEDAVGRLVEQAHPGNKVPLSVIAGGLLGLPDLITLQGNLDTYLKQRNIDPQSISKLTALKASAGTVLSALQFERDHARADDRVGVVTFGTDATVLSPVTPQVAALAPAIQGLQTDGSTNVGAGLEQALQLLTGQPNPSVILMTDGWNNYGMTNDQVLSGPVRQAVAAHVPVCTVGIGQSPSDVDQRLLLDIAGRTGGGYHFAAGGVTLGGDLLGCHHALAGQWLADQRGTVSQGQVAQGPGFTVPAGRQRLSVTLTWPGSQLDLRVTDPAGKPVGAGYPGAAVGHSGGLAALTVVNPAAGHWSMGVAGLQTEAGGERFLATASTDGSTASPSRDALIGGSAPLDDMERDLRIAEYVSAGVIALIIVLWLISLVLRAGRRLAGRGRPAAPTYVVPPSPTTFGSEPAAYPAYTGGPPLPPPVAAVPPPARTRSGTGCLGCMTFVLALIVLGASALGLYLWTTPLLTFPG
jgi:hypothetical protein